MGEQAVRLLYVGHRPADVALINRLLLRAMGNGASRLDSVFSIAEALERLVHSDYDLLLLDEHIDARPGADIVRELRRQHKVVPIVFLTDRDDEQTLPDVLRCGANDFLNRATLNEFKLSRTIRCVLCLRKREAQARHAQDRLRKLSRAVEQSADLVIITDRGGNIEYVNPAFEELTGYARDEVLSQQPSLLKSGEQTSAFYREMWDTILSGNVFRGVLANKKKNGDIFYAEKTITPVRDSGGRITHFISTDRDITDRRKLEAQLLQAQKMDAIGQLAGGVAHDFNNLLMVISSYAELALDSLTPSHSLHNNILEILHAARRAADLTRQLLAFSRKQNQCLRHLDLNEVLQELGRMLPRLIGEDIQLALVSGQELGKVRADAVQMEQVIINLAVNARDAMPHGGKLSIETSNIQLEDEYVHNHPIVPPGEYVLLTVTDSGQGIPREHLPHIFEPFFTTKEAGKGTGLGLATVYGIVKQSAGFIWVYSEPGLGTTFKIYLPRVADKKRKTSTPVHTQSYQRGYETVLYVEDEEAVRQPACTFLTRCGYKVLQAANGEDAIRIAQAHEGQIQLMITDVVMPGMSGSRLAEHLCQLRPQIKVLYVSGYANPTLLQHGVDDVQAVFLQKPFTLKTLAWKVRQVLSGAKKQEAREPLASFSEQGLASQSR